MIISISIYMCYQCVFSVMMTADNDDDGDDNDNFSQSNHRDTVA